MWGCRAVQLRPICQLHFNKKHLKSNKISVIRFFEKSIKPAATKGAGCGWGCWGPRAQAREQGQVPVWAPCDRHGPRLRCRCTPMSESGYWSLERAAQGGSYAEQVGGLGFERMALLADSRGCWRCGGWEVPEELCQSDSWWGWAGEADKIKLWLKCHAPPSLPSPDSVSGMPLACRGVLDRSGPCDQLRGTVLPPAHSH